MIESPYFALLGYETHAGLCVCVCMYVCVCVYRYVLTHAQVHRLICVRTRMRVCMGERLFVNHTTFTCCIRVLCQSFNHFLSIYMPPCFLNVTPSHPS